MFGPGHNSFVKSPDQTEDWIVYHAKDTTFQTWAGRTARAQKFTWLADGTPDFGRPVAAIAALQVPSGEVRTTPPSAPVLLTEEGVDRVATLNSVTLMRDPFPHVTTYNFSLDQRTRLMLFATNVELMPGENASIVTAQAKDSQNRIFPLTVEFVGKVPSFDWLTQINVRLPDGIENAGQVRVSISLRGVSSNEAIIRVRPSQ